MAATKVPTTVGELLASVKGNIASINKHRQAMAEVAAQAKATQPNQPETGGVTK